MVDGAVLHRGISKRGYTARAADDARRTRTQSLNIITTHKSFYSQIPAGKDGDRRA